MTDTFERSSVERPETPVFAGQSGDGGNRTHARVHPSPETQLRGTALALRDLAETTGATEASLTFPDATILHWHTEDGCHLLTSEKGIIDLTEWIDQPGLLPAEGVESVRDQLITRAAVASAERGS